jgi:GNAT superfamily N-acetyltransferase
MEIMETATSPSMISTIRPANLETDRQLLVDLLCRNLSPQAGGHRFNWLYRENPYGSARAWIASDQGTGKSIGAAAAFPRKLFVGGIKRPGYVLGDFCIDHQYRSLGVALQLQRACLEQVSTESLALTYDFPSDRMMAIYRRMQIGPMGQLVRWSKPLRADRKIGRLVKSAALTKILAAPVNQLLEWRDARSEWNGKYTIVQHQGDCTEEFTRLANGVSSRYGICVARTAEYLNWRYLSHPSVRHELLTARRDGELKGYIVFTHTENDARIVDLFGLDDTDMWTSLVTRAAGLLRPRRISTLSFPVLAMKPWAGLLKQWGFHPRESSQVVVHVPEKITETAEFAAAPWFLVDGDRES